MPSPRSSGRGRPLRRRSRAAREAQSGRVARPRRRTRPGRRGGSSRPPHEHMFAQIVPGSAGRSRRSTPLPDFALRVPVDALNGAHPICIRGSTYASSRPPLPLTRSRSPSPLKRRSSPGPPMSWSAPNSPLRMSFPGPPRIRSGPEPPSMRSSPPPPEIELRSLLPTWISLRGSAKHAAPSGSDDAAKPNLPPRAYLREASKQDRSLAATSHVLRVNRSRRVESQQFRNSHSKSGFRMRSVAVGRPGGVRLLDVGGRRETRSLRPSAPMITRSTPT